MTGKRVNTATKGDASTAGAAAKKLKGNLDVVWALRTRNQQTGCESPVGDQCLNCFQVWQAAFKHLTWAELIEALGDDENVKRNWAEALAIKDGKKERPWKEMVVKKNSSVVLEVCKEFIVLTEKELKKCWGVEKLGKDDLKGIPKIELHIAEGIVETVFCFKNPQSPFRTCKVRYLKEDAIGETVMNPSEQLWGGQAEWCMKASHKQTSEDSGLTDLLNKDVLPSLDLARASPAGTPLHGIG
eukprot:2280128-Amphidinium_carterae.1